MADLIARGQEKISWAPASCRVRAISVHLEAKTAVLAFTLHEAGGGQGCGHVVLGGQGIGAGDRHLGPGLV